MCRVYFQLYNPAFDRDGMHQFSKAQRGLKLALKLFSSEWILLRWRTRYTILLVHDEPSEKCLGKGWLRCRSWRSKILKWSSHRGFASNYWNMYCAIEANLLGLKRRKRLVCKKHRSTTFCNCLACLWILRPFLLLTICIDFFRFQLYQGSRKSRTVLAASACDWLYFEFTSPFYFMLNNRKKWRSQTITFKRRCKKKHFLTMLTQRHSKLILQAWWLAQESG